MTQIKSEVLLASVNAITGDILYTFKWTYPRVILPEVMTHRVLSRNTSSSRAIPNKKQRGKVWSDPFTPCYIGESKRGMQAGDELSGFKRSVARSVWNLARIPTLGAAWLLDRLGVHKQVSNRLIEPWTWTEQLVSTTELDNFIALRNHKDAEPHILELARQVADQKRLIEDIANYCLVKNKLHYIPETKWAQYDMGIHTVQKLEHGEWHLPFVDSKDRHLSTLELKQVSAARCARVSYNMPDTGKKSSLEDDLKLFDRLAGSNPKHLSPLEHQATPLLRAEFSGNFKGWEQFRKEYE